MPGSKCIRSPAVVSVVAVCLLVGLAITYSDHLMPSTVPVARDGGKWFGVVKIPLMPDLARISSGFLSQMTEDVDEVISKQVLASRVNMIEPGRGKISSSSCIRLDISFIILDEPQYYQKPNKVTTLRSSLTLSPGRKSSPTAPSQRKRFWAP